MKKKTLSEYCQEEIEWAEEQLLTVPDYLTDKANRKEYIGWREGWRDAHEQIKELYADQSNFNAETHKQQQQEK